MGKNDSSDLMKFLKPFDKHIREMVLWLREFVWEMYPEANELIYDNYNALAIGWSPTERAGHVFCGVSIFRTNGNIHFGFFWGSEIADPAKMLLGEGKQYRYILVKNRKDFPTKYIKRLLQEAYENSLQKIKDKSQIKKGLTITKSISAKKRELKKNG